MTYLNVEIPRAVIARVTALAKARAVTREYPWLNRDIVRVALEEWADREERRQQREEERAEE